MNKEIDLKKILNKHHHFIITMKGEDSILAAMREACEQAIDLCADNAEADYTWLGSHSEASIDTDLEVYVLKNSILDCKKFIK